MWKQHSSHSRSLIEIAIKGLKLSSPLGCCALIWRHSVIWNEYRIIIQDLEALNNVLLVDFISSVMFSCHSDVTQLNT